MKALLQIAIAIASIVLAEAVVYWVLTSNLEAGIYPTEADSISIPLFTSLIFASASLLLIVLAILCQLGPRVLVLLGCFLFLAAAAVSGLRAWSWAAPNHYLVSLSYSIISIGSVMAALFTFRGQSSNKSFKRTPNGAA